MCVSAPPTRPKTARAWRSNGGRSKARVFRSALDALQVCNQLQQRGVALHLLDLGGDVTGNGMAGLFMKIAAAFAEFERERISERVRDVKADQRSRGRYLGGKVPFGYRVEGGMLVPVPEQQAAVKTMVRLGRQGTSLRKVADAVKLKHGLTVSRMAVKRILDERKAEAERRG